MLKLFRYFYETTLKGNSCLKRAVLTGVINLMKSGLFSGANHLKKYNFTSKKFSKHYGLNQEEIEKYYQEYETTPDV